MLEKREKRNRIHRKIRSKIFGTKVRPRLYVFKSANHMYAQLIDDESNKILASMSDVSAKSSFGKAQGKKGKKTDRSMEVGRMIARVALAKKIEKVVFDRGGFLFHGRIKALADGAREEGLKF